MKRFARLLGLIVISIVLLIPIACSSKDPTQRISGEGEKESGKVTLKLGADAWMVEKLKLDQAVKKFNANHPDIQVQISPYADRTVLSTFALQWSQGKTDVDIAMVDGTATAVQFLAKDLLIDFNETDFFQGPTAKENFVGNSVSFGEIDGFQFAIPISLETYAINVNKKMFEEAGLLDADGKVIQPKDWNELYEYAKKMTKVEGGKVTQQGMTIQWGPNAQSTLISVAQAMNGTFYDKDGVLTFDTPEMREMLEIWKKGADEGVFSIDTFTNKDAGRNNYKADQVAMLLQSGSHAPEAEPTVGEGNTTVIPIPGSEVNGSYAFTAGIIVPRASKNQEAAVQFIQEALMDGETQIAAGTEWGKLPVIKEHFDQIDAEWKDNLLAIIEKSVTAPFYKEYPVLINEVPKLLQQYLTGEMDLDTFIEEVEAMIDDIDKNVK
ncbi:ABC transporter substrate-binding protein [Fredinandcohnia sp. FSL W7-1320]|uniref:ABC transporter substrate-binding protein n=1 Tax=Fredinandcohnia sp. FSL W7-1320 TaxID=2954540 RepID=UPI0030FDCE04